MAPSEPRNVSIDSIGGTWAVISWLTPVFIGRPPITEYRITATSLLNRNTSTAVQNETNTLAVNVTGLLPATEYKFTVAAVSVVQATEIFIAESPQSIADNGTTLLTGSWVPSHSRTQSRPHTFISDWEECWCTGWWNSCRFSFSYHNSIQAHDVVYANILL